MELHNYRRAGYTESQGITLKQLLQMDSPIGGPLDRNPVPYLVTKRWVYDQYLVWWHGDERSSPGWMSRVRGQSPEQSHNALIKLAWLERAKRRALENPVLDTGQRLVAGVDVGGVISETVVYLCRSPGAIQRSSNSVPGAVTILGVRGRFFAAVPREISHRPGGRRWDRIQFRVASARQGLPVDPVHVAFQWKASLISKRTIRPYAFPIRKRKCTKGSRICWSTRR